MASSSSYYCPKSHDACYKKDGDKITCYNYKGKSALGSSMITEDSKEISKMNTCKKEETMGFVLLGIVVLLIIIIVALVIHHKTQKGVKA